MPSPEPSMPSPEPLPDFDALWDYDRPGATEAELAKLLPRARASGDREYTAQLLTQIARAQGLQMKFDLASRTLDEAEALLAGAAGGTGVARVRLLLERGRLLRSSKRAGESRAWFLDAFDRARECGAEAYAVDAAHMLAIAETGAASLDWNRRAIEIAERSADPKARRWLGSLYNNLGWTRHDAGEHEEALGLFRRALAAREAEGQDGPVRVARWCVARALRSLGRVEEALQLQRRLLAEWESSGSADGYVSEEIGECLLALGRGDEAGPHFAAAYRSLSDDRWLARDEPERLDRMRRLGGIESGARGR